MLKANERSAEAGRAKLTRELRGAWWVIAWGFFAVQFVSYTFGFIMPALPPETYALGPYDAVQLAFGAGLILGAAAGGVLCDFRGQRSAWLFFVAVLAFGALATPLGPMLIQRLLALVGFANGQWLFALNLLILALLPAGSKYLTAQAVTVTETAAPRPWGQLAVLLALMVCTLYQLTGKGFYFPLPYLWPAPLAIGATLLLGKFVGYGLLALIIDRCQRQRLLAGSALLAGACCLLRFALLTWASPSPANYPPLAAAAPPELLLIPLTIVLALAAHAFVALSLITAAESLPAQAPGQILGLMLALALVLALCLQAKPLPAFSSALLYIIAAALVLLCWRGQRPT